MPPPPRHPPGPPPANKPAATNRGWDPVAAWYDKLVGEAGSDYHRQVILPAALRLLEPRPGESVIDVCCGQGVLAKHLLDMGIARFTGVDASPRLLEAAQSRHGKDPRIAWVLADVCQPGAWADGSHAAVACVMAVHDVADLGLTLTYACCRWTSSAWCTMWWTWARPWCASRSSWSTTWLLDACPSLRGTRAASCRYCITCLATQGR